MTFWTYVGQIVNFLIFVAILYYLLYKPVRNIMRKRREEMESDLHEAEKQRAEAEELRKKAEEERRQLDEQRDEILQKARDEADQEKTERLEQVEDQARDRLERFRRIMEHERREVVGSVTDELRETIVKVCGHVLEDVQDVLINRAVDRAETLLGELSDEDRERAREALEEADKAVPVRFAGAVTDEQLDRLRKLITDALDVKKVELELDEDASLVAGLEVTLGHVRLEAHWRGVIDEALRKETAQEPESEDDGDEAEDKSD
jgi:F-type H+-transporting ATPase subunit b